MPEKFDAGNIKNKVQGVLARLMESDFVRRYGLCGVLALAAAALKFVLFYDLMGVRSHFAETLLVSLLLVFLLFKAPKNKWIPAVIYFLISVLIFCDSMYFAHFNRYLSVNMLGAAGFLSDIGESIKAILDFKHVYLFADSLLIFFTLGVAAFIASREVPSEADSSDNAATSGAGGIAAEGIMADTVTDTGASATAGDAMTDMVTDAAGENRDLGENFAEGENVAPSKVTIKEKLHSFIYDGIFARRKYHPVAVTAILMAVILANPFASSTATAVANQELFSFHLSDIIQNKLSGGGDRGSLAAYEGNYEEEKIGPYFGIAAGRNLIVIQLESFQNFVVGMEYNGQEVTPVLNSLIAQDSIYFDNFYHQTGSGNTSDAEFAVNDSVHGSLMSYTYKLYEDNYFRALPTLLSERGYDTAVFHAYDDRDFWNREVMYPKQGFRRFYGGFKKIKEQGYYNSLEPGKKNGDYEYGDWIGWGLSDHDFYRQTAAFMADELSAPYYAFLISLSNHHPFDIPEEYRQLELLPEDEDTLVGNYLQGCAYTDYALGVFLDELKARGIYEHSAFAIYGDHVGLTHTKDVDSDMERLLGHSYDIPDMMNIPLVLHIPGCGITARTHRAGGQLDLMPTLAALLGFEELDTVYLGHNLLGEKAVREGGFVAIQTYMPKGSFVTDDIIFEMSRDGVFENSRVWNIWTGEELDPSDFRELSERSAEVIETSDFILKSDALRGIYEEGLSPEDAGSLTVHRDNFESIYIAGYPEKNLMGTNSVAALDASYDYSPYRMKCLMLEASVDEDGKPLFESDKPVRTVRNRAGDRVTTKPMSAEELAEWMGTHGAVNIVVRVSRGDVERFRSYMLSLNESLADRLILEIRDFEEYSGRYDEIVSYESAFEALYERGREEMLPALEMIKKPWAIFAEDKNMARLIGEAVPGAAEYSNIYAYNKDGYYELYSEAGE